jgi:hypothetical protein
MVLEEFDELNEMAWWIWWMGVVQFPWRRGA